MDLEAVQSEKDMPAISNGLNESLHLNVMSVVVLHHTIPRTCRRVE